MRGHVNVARQPVNRLESGARRPAGRGQGPSRCSTSSIDPHRATQQSDKPWPKQGCRPRRTQRTRCPREASVIFGSWRELLPRLRSDSRGCARRADSSFQGSGCVPGPGGGFRARGARRDGGGQQLARAGRRGADSTAGRPRRPRRRRQPPAVRRSTVRNARPSGRPRRLLRPRSRDFLEAPSAAVSLRARWFRKAHRIAVALGSELL
jgi:hypothetical protein